MVRDTGCEISLRHFPDESFSIHIPTYSHQNLLDEDDFLLQNADISVTPVATARRDTVLPLKSPAPDLSLLNVTTSAVDRNSRAELSDTELGGSSILSATSGPENPRSTQEVLAALGEVSAGSTSRPRKAPFKTLTSKPNTSKRSVTCVATRPPITREPVNSDTVSHNEKTIVTGVSRDRDSKAPDRDFLQKHPIASTHIVSSASSAGSTDPAQAPFSSESTSVALEPETFVTAVPVKPSKSTYMKSDQFPPEVSNKVNLSARTGENNRPTSRLRHPASSVPGPSTATTTTSTSSGSSSSRSRSRSTGKTEQNGPKETRNPLANSSANAVGPGSDSNQIAVRESCILEKRYLRKSKLHPIPDFKMQHAMHDAAMSKRRKKVAPTVPIPIVFSTDDRAKERAKFDERVKERDLELERARKELRRQREAQEELEIKELRRKAVPKAHEVPEWYKDAPKRDRDLAGTRSGLGSKH